MRKSTRLVKRLLALFLVVLMSIESFAAVVGDNDGAAFITKAEFDSLKNDFQSQLDRYNSSLDNKIDGAIAAYLSGISITKQHQLEPRIEHYYNINWINNFAWPAERIVYQDSVTWGRSALGWSKMIYNRVRNIRNGNLRLWFSTTGDIGTTSFLFKYNKIRNKQFDSLWFAGTNNWSLPVPVWILSQVENTWSYTDNQGAPKLWFEKCVEPRAYGGYIKTAGNWREYQPDWNGNYGATFDCLQTATDPDTYPKLSPVLNPTAEGEILNTTIKFYNNGSTNIVEYTGALSSRNCNICASWEGQWFNSVNWANFTPGHNLGDSDEFSRLAAAEADYPKCNNTIRDRLVNVWRYCLLGNDDDTLCNVGYLLDSSILELGPVNKYDWQNAEFEELDSGELIVYINSQSKLPNSLSKQTTVQDTVISYPLWPQIKHSELVNGQMLIDGTTPATLGAGLPLVKDITDSGVLSLKIQGKNYDISSDDLATSDQKVKIYIKKGSFLHKNNIDFYTLQDNPTKTLNGYVIDDFTKETTLSFDVNKGDEIWMRIGPYEPGPTSKYTRISSLTMNLLTN